MARWTLRKLPLYATPDPILHSFTLRACPTVVQRPIRSQRSIPYARRPFQEYAYSYWGYSLLASSFS
jgi:hypothetical protein